MKKRNEFAWAYYSMAVLGVSAVSVKMLCLLHLAIPFETLMIAVAILFVLVFAYNHLQKLVKEASR